MSQVMATPGTPFVMMPVREHNRLGTFGFFVAFIGLFIPTGLVAMLGFILSLAAIGRSPRGFATAGVIFGLIGSLFWLLMMAIFVVVGAIGAVIGMVGAAGAFVMTQPEIVEVTSDMANVAISAAVYEEDEGRPATSIDDLGLTVAARIDPWGNGYRFERVDDDPGFDITSAGVDGAFGTDDDIQLSRLDLAWERALATFEDRMEDLGRKMEKLQSAPGGAWAAGPGCCVTANAASPAVQQRIIRRFPSRAAMYEAAATAAAQSGGNITINVNEDGTTEIITGSSEQDAPEAEDDPAQEPVEVEAEVEVGAEVELE
jgi:hypothetical protein